MVVCQPFTGTLNALQCQLSQAIRSTIVHKKITRHIEIIPPHADYCLKQYITEQMEPETGNEIVRKRLYFLVAIDGCGDHITRMETGKQREIVYRIATNGVIPIDEGRNLPRIAQNSPQSQILMYQATPVELK